MTIYEYEGTPITCGGAVTTMGGFSCGGVLHASLSLRDDGTPDRATYGWSGDGVYPDPHVVNNIIDRNSHPSSWIETLGTTFDGRGLLINIAGADAPLQALTFYYWNPGHWFAARGDAPYVVGIDTSGVSFMGMDNLWAVTGTMWQITPEPSSNVPEPSVLALLLIGIAVATTLLQKR